MSTKTRFLLKVDPEVCVGHGRCYDLAPDLFEPEDDEEGCARTLVPHPGPDQIAAARLAVQSCPEYAITLVEEDGP